jgi:hypothetical protein
MRVHAIASLFQARLIIAILRGTMHRLALHLTPVFAAYLKSGWVAAISLAAALGARTMHNWSDWLSLASGRFLVFEAYPSFGTGHFDGGGKNAPRYCRYPGQSPGAGGLSLSVLGFWRNRRRHADK